MPGSQGNNVNNMSNMSDGKNKNENKPMVLIIGGGLGGLGFAQALRKSNIPFHIFERDDAANWRAQGYRIRISGQGSDALRKLLPNDTWRTFEATCAEVGKLGHNLNASSGDSLSWPIANPSRGPKTYNADRTTLRNVLLKGLEKDISYGKKLDSYELPPPTYETGELQVIAHFTDGSSAQGHLLVGADGVKSVVRRQLIPDDVLLDTEGRAVLGKTPLTPDLFHHLNPNGQNDGDENDDDQENESGNDESDTVQPELGQGLSLCINPDDFASRPVRLVCDVMRFNRSSKLRACREQAGVHVPRDYIYWALLFHRDVTSLTDEELASRTPQQSMDLSLEVTSPWHPAIRNLFVKQAPEAASTLSFLTQKPDSGCVWAADGQVTLLGDAAHPVPPVGAIGTNCAFADAARLLDVVLESTSAKGVEGEEGYRDGGVDDLARAVLEDYEPDMRDDASQTVRMTTGGARGFFGMKPIRKLEPINR